MARPKCTTTPHFEYWVEVNGFCDEHKEAIVERLDSVIAAEIEAIATEMDLEELGSIENHERPDSEGPFEQRQCHKETVH